MLHPLPLGTFLTKHWAKTPLHIARRNTSYYRDLMTIEDIEAMYGLASEPGLAFSSPTVEL